MFEPSLPADSPLATGASQEVKPLTNQALETRPADAISAFLQDVVQIDQKTLAENKVSITREEQVRGAARATISHNKQHQGREWNFTYHIVETDAASVTIRKFQSVSKLGGEISVPRGPWSAQLREQLIARWKMLTIADPVLYERHRLKYSPKKGDQPQGTTAKLETYQQRAISECLGNLCAYKSALCVMPTGTGKTVVGMHVLDQYVRMLQVLNPGHSTRVLFLVNRTELLNQAANELERWFPGKYSIGRVYEGQSDMDKDVVFATSASLLLGGRLELLLQGAPISLVVHDETHHLSAEGLDSIYKQIQQRSDSQGWGTATLGLTATPERGDGGNVSSPYYDRNVSLYGKLQAYNVGNLVPIEYVPAHMYLDPSRSIEDFSQLQVIWEIYQQEVARSPDSRCLFICRDIVQADQLAKFFNQQAQSGDTPLAVALHSELKNREPEKFDTYYNGWKSEQWARDNGVKAPQVVMSVDMFKEGIDVPEIQTLFLCKKLSCRTSFIQTIGRALRVAPFKPSARVVDFQKAYALKEIREHLDMHSPMVTWRGMNQQVEGSDSKSSEQDFEPVAIEEREKDVPHYLVYLFGEYDSIPKFGILLLDRYIDTKLQGGAIGSIADLRQLAEELKQGVSDQRAVAIRRLLRPCFGAEAGPQSDVMSEMGDVVYRTKANMITFLRLADLICKDSGVDYREHPKLLAAIFKEFDPSYEDLLKNRRRNLIFLRTKVLGLPDTEVAAQFQELVKKLDDESFPEGFKRVIQSAGQDQEEVDRAWYIQSAEGTLGEKPAQHKQNRVVVSSNQRKTIGGDEGQHVTIAAYLHHPKLKGRLSRQDFDLTPKEFCKHLEKQGVFDSIPSLIQYVLKISRANIAVIRAHAKAERPKQFKAAAAELQTTLRLLESNKDEFWKNYPPSAVQTTAGWLTTLDEAIEGCSDSDVRECLEYARGTFQDGMRSVVARHEEPLTKRSKNEAVIAALQKNGSIAISLKIVCEDAATPVHLPLFTLNSTQGVFGRTMVTVEFSGQEQKLVSLVKSKQKQIQKAIGNCLLMVENRWGANTTYLIQDVPSMRGFLQGLASQLQESNKAVISGVSCFSASDKRPKKNASAGDSASSGERAKNLEPFQINEMGALQSYVPYVGPRYHHYIERAKSQGATPKELAMLRLELACYQIPQAINHDIPKWQAAMQDYHSDPVCKAALEYLEGRLAHSVAILRGESKAPEEALRVINSIVGALPKVDAEGRVIESVQLLILMTALNRMNDETLTVKRTRASTVLPPRAPTLETSSQLTPVLRDINYIRYFRNIGHSQFDGVCDEAEKWLRLAMNDLSNSRCLGQASLDALPALKTQLKEATDQTRLLALPAPQRPRQESSYFTQSSEGALIEHVAEDCPVALNQERLKREIKEDERTCPCSVCKP
jgi:superfamily II DNA or RNA helicase